MNYLLLRIDTIVGIHYQTDKPTDTLIIYGIGAPNVPDLGGLPDAQIILEHGYDIFVPDYIGFGRSDGDFTPMNCINTFLDLHEKFKKGCVGVNIAESITKNLQYSRVIYVGRSFGGSYVPLLPKYNPEINEIALIYPFVDYAQAGKRNDESNELFLESMIKDGYKHLYRGINQPVWEEHLIYQTDGLDPIKNLEYLQNCKVFIGHGKADTCIYYENSVNYYNKLVEQFPQQKKNYCLRLYEAGHNSATSNLAMQDFLGWIG